MCFSLNYSLNPDDSVAYIINIQTHSWIDQPNLRFRSEAAQAGTDAPPKFAIGDGTLVVTQEGNWTIPEGPDFPIRTQVNAISDPLSTVDALASLKAGESLFPPMGTVYSGSFNSEIFPSAYVVQNPGVYLAEALETVAGRETLKVSYNDADRWGRKAIQSIFWVDTETGLVLKTLRESHEYHTKSESEITSIRYNPVVDAALFNTEDIMPDLGLETMQNRTINETTIYAGNPEVVDDQVNLRVCYELPSSADWMLFDMQVNNDAQINFQGYSFYMEPAGTRQARGMRCEVLSFPYSAKQEKIHLQIGQLYAPAREGTSCDHSDKVTQTLAENGMAIQFTCLEDYGMTTIEISENPAGMSEEEARTKVNELLYQYNNESLPGPWEFDLSVEK